MARNSSRSRALTLPWASRTTAMSSMLSRSITARAYARYPRGLDTAGMMVRVGSNDQPATAAREAAVLEVTSGEARAVVRPGHPVVIGRDASCDLVLDNKLVSRRHAE